MTAHRLLTMWGKSLDGLTKEVGIVHSNSTLSCLTLYSVGKVFIGKSAPCSVAHVDSYRSSLPEDEQQKLSADPTGPFFRWTKYAREVPHVPVYNTSHSSWAGRATLEHTEWTRISTHHDCSVHGNKSNALKLIKKLRSLSVLIKAVLC